MKNFLSVAKLLSSKLSALLWLCLTIVLVLSLSEQISNNIKIETNILQLLPKTESDPILELAFENYAEKNMQQVVFLIQNSDEIKAIESAEKVAGILEKSTWIESVTAKIASKNQAEIGQIIFDYRHHLLTEEDRRLLNKKQYQVFSDDVVQTIFSPLSGGLAGLVQTDPFLLSYRYSQNGLAKSVLDLKQGYLTTKYKGNYFVLVTAKLNASPFDPKVQDSILSELKNLEEKWLHSEHQKAEGKSHIIRTGALFYAALAYDTAKNEISTIGVSSLLLVIGLVFFAFRSIRPLILTAVALTFGIGSGLTVIVAIFGEIHLLTLVFGASLIGVAVDYAFHFFAVEETLQGCHRLKRIFPAISLGLISSVAGYLALLSTPFPGLQQMAVFCIAGLVGAFLTVALLFPVFRLGNNISTTLVTFCDSILGWGGWKSAQKIWYLMWGLPVIAFLLSFYSADGTDNIRQFQTVNHSLKEQEKLIKNILQPAASNQFYVVTGKNPQQLLVNLESTQESLVSLKKQGVILGFQNISQQLPSIKQQISNYSLYEGLYASIASAKLIELGVLTPQKYVNIKKDFEADIQHYLEPEFWFESSLGDSYSHLWLGKIGNQYAAIIPLEGIENLSRLKDIDKHTLFVDKVSKVTEVFTKYRQRTTQLLFIAILLIGTILSLRYGIKKAVFIVSSPLFAISITVILLTILGVPMTLFNTLALFLVVGIGIDYGLFFAESTALKANILLAILLSALTTIFAFGLLALSETVAIRSFGLTMLIGISSAFVLSPLIGYLVVGNRRGLDAKKQAERGNNAFC